MRNIETIEKEELRNVLNKNWMTHDAMWFANSVAQVGIEKTNQINTAAAKGMAKIEINRLTKLLETHGINSFSELKEFITNAFEIIQGDFMDFRISFPEENVLQWDVPQCFAYDGVKKMGILPQYQCAIFSRLDGWLEVLNIPYKPVPQFEGCLKYQTGECSRTYNFEFN